MEKNKLEPLYAAYRDALQADAIWSAELKAKYGKRAGDMRYKAQGAMLPGYIGFRVTTDRWLRLVQERREEQNNGL